MGIGRTPIELPGGRPDPHDISIPEVEYQRRLAIWEKRKIVDPEGVAREERAREQKQEEQEKRDRENIRDLDEMFRVMRGTEKADRYASLRRFNHLLKDQDVDVSRFKLAISTALTGQEAEIAQAEQKIKKIRREADDAHVAKQRELLDGIWEDKSSEERDGLRAQMKEWEREHKEQTQEDLIRAQNIEYSLETDRADIQQFQRLVERFLLEGDYPTVTETVQHMVHERVQSMDKSTTRRRN